jgi:hypothetical protein
MIKKKKSFGLCGDSKPSLDLAPSQLRAARAGAGASITPSGTPALTAPLPPGTNG